MTLLANWKFDWKNSHLNMARGKGVCLDLGCGDGRHRKVIEDAGWTYIGCDIDKSRGGATIVYDGKRLPFTDKSIDNVVIWQVLEHVNDPNATLHEIRRVLADGGSVYGSVSCMEPFHDECMYYGFTGAGIKCALLGAGFREVELSSGINAFSLILRGLLIRLLPKKWGERAAFIIARIGIVALVYPIFYLRAVTSLIRRGHLSDDFVKAREYIAEVAPFHFAGHIQFVATA